jgi:hypothetical protein
MLLFLIAEGILILPARQTEAPPPRKTRRSEEQPA